MKLATTIDYSGNFHADVARTQDLERAGVDLVWVAEAYSFDSISLIGYLAAKTSTIQIGTGIINVYSRTASAVAQTAAGCDFVTGGRFVLGLGASGPQVIEGFHGVPYDKPMARIIDYINVCRLALRREPVVYEGPTVHVPLPVGEGTGLGKALKIINHPVRSEVPIFWASMKGNSVAATARVADGWLPIFYFFDPTKFADVWGDDLARGLAERDPALGPLQISAGGMLAIGDEYAGAGADAVLDLARPSYALYIGGMGARGQNFYTELAARYGYEREAKEIQDLYLDGNKDEAARLVPREMLVNTNLVGSAGDVAERIAAHRQAGVTHLQVMPATPDPVAAVDQLRALL
jgi:F420-dependent oxidoreductase-like protein